MPVRPQTIDLDEGPGQLFRLPWRGRFARTQPHRDVLDPHRLSRPERKIADDAVALVEQAQHRDAFGHRRHAGLLGRRAGYVDRHRLVFGGLFGPVTAARDQQETKREDESVTGHAWSGFHAS